MRAADPRLRRQVGAAPRPGDDHQRGVHADARSSSTSAFDILEAYEKATTEGDRKGAVMFGDEMIDEASRKMANKFVTRGERAGMHRSVRVNRTGSNRARAGILRRVNSHGVDADDEPHGALTRAHASNPATAPGFERSAVLLAGRLEEDPMEPLYLTTAIPFVNGAPHLGHALELVADRRDRPPRPPPRAADPLPDRHRRARAEGRAGRGRRRASTSRRSSTANANAVRRRSPRRCGSRTTTSSAPAPIRVTRRRSRRSGDACLATGDLYRAPYAGWYCAGCEEFVDGACDEHDAPPEWVEEENWYFRLSRYARADPRR